MKKFVPITIIPCKNNIPQFVGIIDGLNVIYDKDDIEKSVFIKPGRLLYKDVIISIDSACIFTNIIISDYVYVCIVSSVGNFNNTQSGAYIYLTETIHSEHIILSQIHQSEGVNELLPRFTLYTKSSFPSSTSNNNIIETIPKQPNQIFGVSNNGVTYEYKSIIGSSNIVIDNELDKIKIKTQNVLVKTNYLNEFETDQEKYNVRANIGLATIDGGTF